MHRNKQIFFFISKILPKKRLFHAKRHEAARNYKEKRTKNCVHKKKRVYKHQKEITRCESPNLRPIKQSTNKHGK